MCNLADDTVSCDLAADVKPLSTRITHAEMNFVAAHTDISQTLARRAERGLRLTWLILIAIFFIAVYAYMTCAAGCFYT